MKLISCHIDNFGKFHDFSWDFHDGLNEFIKNNGWGKTTFATFIKVMFYGFDNERKKDIASNERKKYEPFQGGIYGGELIFELNQKRYRCQRKFMSSNSQDVFQLYDAETNLVSNDFTNQLGREIFGIDSTTFFNTLYYAQRMEDLFITPDVHAKIGNVSDEDADLSSYSKAMDLIHKEMNRYHPTYKRSELRELEDKIQQLHQKQYELHDLKEKMSELIEHQKSMNHDEQELEQQLNQTEETIQHYSTIEKRSVYQEEFAQLDSSLQKLHEEYEYCVKNSQVAYLSEKSIQELLKFRMKYESLLSLNDEMSQKEQQEFVVLLNKFQKRNLSSDKIAQIQNQHEQILRKRQNSKQILYSNYEKKQLQHWQQVFESASFSYPELCELIDLVGAMSQRTSDEDKNLLNYATTNQWLLYVVVLVLMFVVMILQWIPMIYPIVAILIATVLFIVQLVGKQKDANRQLNVARLQNQQYQQKALRLLQTCGYETDEKDIFDSLLELKNNYLLYQSVLEKIEHSNQGLTDEEVQFEKQLYIFLKDLSYDVDHKDISYCLLELSHEYQRYQDYVRVYRSKAKRRIEKKKYEELFERFHTKYHISTSIESLTQAQEDYKKLKALDALIEDGTKKRDQCKNKLEQLQKDGRNIQSNVSLEDLQLTYRQLHQQKDKMMKDMLENKQQIDSIQRKIQGLAHIDVEEKSSKQQLKEYQDYYDLLVKVEENMEIAKASFTKQFLGVLQQKFEYYYDQLHLHDSKNLVFDSNLAMQVQDGALFHDMKQLSDGYQDAVNFARRLAIIDVMYDGEIPFLILDDPFVNFDDETLHNAKMLLEQLSNKHQIIYFTCYSTRAIVQ